MRRVVPVIVLSLFAAGMLAGSVCAEEQVAPAPVATAPDEVRLNELTAQYTLLYQVGAHEKAIPVVYGVFYLSQFLNLPDAVQKWVNAVSLWQAAYLFCFFGPELRVRKSGG